MAWIVLVVAGLLEVVWAFAMKQSEGFSRLWPSVVTLVAMGLSFACLAWSMRSLPLGTAMGACALCAACAARRGRLRLARRHRRQRVYDRRHLDRRAHRRLAAATAGWHPARARAGEAQHRKRRAHADVNVRADGLGG